MDKDEELFNRIFQLLEVGPSQELVDLINRILTDDPALSGRWLDEAMELGYRGEYDRADDYFMVLYIVRGGDPGIMLLKAVNAWLQGHNKQAAGICRDFLRRHPGCAGFHLTLANAEYGMGRYKAALRAFYSFLEAEPADVLGWCGKGLALRALGKEDEALACFREVLKLEPGCARGYLGTAKHHVSYGLFREALLFLERSLALDPGLKEAWLYKGIALYETGRCKEALACRDRADGNDALAALEGKWR